MADTPKTPDGPTDAPTSAPKRRRTPRASTTTPAASPPRKRAPKATPVTTDTASVPAKRAAPPKSRSTKRATPAPKPRVAAEPDKSRIARVTEKVSGRWTTAALVAASGAAVAALFTLRGSAPKPPRLPAPVRTSDPAGRAHQADGTDATASFQAGIADEGTIPE